MTDPERPRCRTCPYWDVDDPRVDPDDWERGGRTVAGVLAFGGTVTGECRRYPRPWNQPTRDSSDEWPWTDDYDWCGEHPRMKQWIEHLESQGKL